MEAISGSNGAPPNAEQISNDLVQKELDDAVTRQFGRHVVIRVISEFAVVVDTTHLDEELKSKSAQ